MSLIYRDRFHPAERRQLQTVIEAGGLQMCDELALFEPEQLRPLALLSLLLFFVGGLFFIALCVLAYTWHAGVISLKLSFWGVLAWIGINLVAYLIILPIHELLHGLVFFAFGGRPYFGARLPLALYCGARNQLFRRNAYLLVGLAPLVVITVLGIVFTCLAPVAASYILLATVGNVSGAAGDILVAWRLRHLSPHVLVEDTDTGYRAWNIVNRM